MEWQRFEGEDTTDKVTITTREGDVLILVRDGKAVRPDELERYIEVV
jgi:hypothetical protein